MARARSARKAGSRATAPAGRGAKAGGTAPVGSATPEHGAAARPVRSPLRQAFLDRGLALVATLADTAPDEVLASALGKATAMDTVATAMTALVFAERTLDVQDRVLAAARARGARHMEELLARAGGAYTAEQLAAVLGKAGGRQTIAVGRKAHRYFGLPTAPGRYAYPKLQVAADGRLLPGLREFLDAFTLPDPWMQLVVLLEPSPRLAGRTPLDALRAGDVDGAAAVARAYGSHGA